MSLDDAAKFYSAAITCLTKLEPSKGNTSLRMEDLFSLSNIHYYTGDWDAAIEESKEVLALSEKEGNAPLHAHAHLWIAKILEGRNKYELCLKYLEKARDEYTRLDDLSGQAHAIWSLGGVLFRMGKYSNALDLETKALELATLAKDNVLVLNCITSIAGVNTEMGNFQKAEEYYLKAGEIGKRIGDPLGLARIYNNLGDLRMRQWRYKDAIPLLEKGVLYSKKSGNIRTLAYCNSNIGESLTHAGELMKARPHLDEATAIFTKLDEKLMTSRHVMIEGVFHRQAKEWDEARRLGKEAVDQAKDLGVPFAVGEYLMEYGVTCRSEGRKDEARDILTRASEIFKDLGADKFLERTVSELKALDGPGPALP